MHDDRDVGGRVTQGAVTEEIEQRREQLPTTAGMQEIEQRREQLPTTAGMQEIEQRREQLPSRSILSPAGS
jgi:hypothetical protein